MIARLTPAEQIEQSYDLAMIALADYLTHVRDAATTIDRLLRILDHAAQRRHRVLVGARVHPRPRPDVGVRNEFPATEVPIKG